MQTSPIKSLQNKSNTDLMLQSNVVYFPETASESFIENQCVLLRYPLLPNTTSALT